MARVEDLTPLNFEKGSPPEAMLRAEQSGRRQDAMRTGNTSYGSQARERRLQTYLTAAAGAHSKRKFRAKELLHRKEQMAEAKRQFDVGQEAEAKRFEIQRQDAYRRERKAEEGGSIFSKVFGGK